MTNGCNEGGGEPKKVPIKEAARTVQTTIEATDGLRAVQLAGLQTVRQAKTTSLTREQARLSQALGSEHPQVAVLSQKIAANQLLATQLKRVTERAQASVPQADADTWIVHGHVRTRELKPVPQVTVALYTRDGHWLRPFGHDCTDENGHFKLCVKPRDAQVKEADQFAQVSRETMDVKAAPDADYAGMAKTVGMDTRAGDRQVFLRVTDGQQKLLAVDTVPLTPRLGQVDYREIILDGKACTPPPDQSAADCPPAAAPKREKVRKTRFLGNSRNRELHDLKNAKKTCQIDEIAADHRVSFNSVEEALKAGYDYCAYCFGKDKSTR